MSSFQQKESKPNQSLKDLMTSRDWMDTYEPSHVDIDYNRSRVFSSSSESDIAKEVPAIKDAAGQRQTFDKSNKSTDWMGEYFNSIGASAGEIGMFPPAPKLSSSPERTSSNASFKSPMRVDNFKMSVDLGNFMTPSMDAAITLLERNKSTDSIALSDMQVDTAPHVPPQKQIEADDSMVQKIVALSEKIKKHDTKRRQQQKQRKKKKTRRNRDPDVKVYVEPANKDVLLGRGGRSNHHPGNIDYRNEVGNLRDWYRSSEKNAKTDLSQLLVDWVHNEQKGRFLKMEESTGLWYIVTNIVARRKASQALREHMTKAEREAKKKDQL
jgi:hypothetical protein